MKLGYLIKEGFKNVLTKHRTMSLASIGVLTCCILMTGAAVLFSMNMNSAMSTVEGNNSIKVFIKRDVSSLDAIKIGEQIKQMDNIDTCEYISREDGLKEIQNMVGAENSSLLNGLSNDTSWLPDSFRISMKDLSQYQDTANQILSIQGVEKITDYTALADKLTRMDKIVTNVGLAVVIILSVVSLFIIANTIRVTMYSRRLEISIMKSVGATNGFIRVPFIVEGIILGIVSGGLAVALLYLLYQKMVSLIANLAVFQAINIHPYLPWMILIFMGIGALFGTLGSMISMGRYLKKEGGSIVGW